MEYALPDTTSKKYASARDELEELKQKHNLREPNRGDSLDNPDVKWRVSKPDYTMANLAYLKGKTRNHAAGSLEEIVENLVKTWEMEASHKSDISQWTTIDHNDYNVQYNGGPITPGETAKEIGNYNWLFAQCSGDLWEQSTDFHSTHQKFTGALTNGFPWECLTVFSGPPHVVFSWRHWAHFSGSYTDPQGNVTTGENQMIELYGMARCTVDANLKIQMIDIQYKPEDFLKVLQGKKDAAELHNAQSIMGPGGQCPFIASLENE